MKPLLLTGHDSNMAELAEICLPSKRAYADRHGLELRVLRDTSGDYPEHHGHPSFQKLRHIMSAFSQGWEEVFWLDADSIITNPSLAPEMFDLRLNRPYAFFVVSGDYKRPGEDGRKPYNRWSAGHMLWRNTRAARVMLHAAMQDHSARWGGLWDQDALQSLAHKHPDWRPLVLPTRAMNSVLPGLTGWDEADWQPGDFLCHFTGIAPDDRPDAARKFLAGLAKKFLAGLNP